MPGINNTPERLWQRLLKTERRLERLEAKYSPGTVTTLHPFTVNPIETSKIYTTPGTSYDYAAFNGWAMGISATAITMKSSISIDNTSSGTTAEIGVTLNTYVEGAVAWANSGTKTVSVSAGTTNGETLTFNWLHGMVDTFPGYGGDPNLSFSVPWYCTLRISYISGDTVDEITVLKPLIWGQFRGTDIGATTIGYV